MNNLGIVVVFVKLLSFQIIIFFTISLNEFPAVFIIKTDANISQMITGCTYVELKYIICQLTYVHHQVTLCNRLQRCVHYNIYSIQRYSINHYYIHRYATPVILTHCCGIVVDKTHLHKTQTIPRSSGTVIYVISYQP